MKSTDKQLENRGLFSETVKEIFLFKSLVEILELLKSKLAVERTVSARFIAHSRDFRCIPYLCSALENEKKLYTKMELSDALAAYGIYALPELIKRLGKIGSNQHKKVPQKEFKKDSYPLPRDIVARTITKIGEDALPLLVDTLKCDDVSVLSECIDAIGFICFYNEDKSCMNDLIDCYNLHCDSNLIKWKIIRAMSAFPSSHDFLDSEFVLLKNDRLKKEIVRSKRLSTLE